ncbi:MAG: fibronectin type III-like domain-contianing protein [Tetrasphaera sp.]|nr:fibronectin type III-like domain-contianing protein [Tetrasphaera sp.]
MLCAVAGDAECAEVTNGHVFAAERGARQGGRTAVSAEVGGDGEARLHSPMLVQAEARGAPPLLGLHPNLVDQVGDMAGQVSMVLRSPGQFSLQVGVPSQTTALLGTGIGPEVDRHNLVRRQLLGARELGDQRVHVSFGLQLPSSGSPQGNHHSASAPWLEIDRGIGHGHTMPVSGPRCHAGDHQTDEFSLTRSSAGSRRSCGCRVATLHALRSQFSARVRLTPVNSGGGQQLLRRPGRVPPTLRVLDRVGHGADAVHQPRIGIVDTAARLTGGLTDRCEFAAGDVEASPSVAKGVREPGVHERFEVSRCGPVLDECPLHVGGSPDPQPERVEQPLLDPGTLGPRGNLLEGRCELGASSHDLGGVALVEEGSLEAVHDLKGLQGERRGYLALGRRVADERSEHGGHARVLIGLTAEHHGKGLVEGDLDRRGDSSEAGRRCRWLVPASPGRGQSRGRGRRARSGGPPRDWRGRHARVRSGPLQAHRARAFETVQLYIRDDVTSVSWADKELKAFRQVELAAGESQVVEVEVPVADCTIVDQPGQRIVEAGRFELLIAPSSRDEVLRRAPFTVVD